MPAYIPRGEFGGTHTALVRSDGRGCAVLYLDTREPSGCGRAGLGFGARQGGLTPRILKWKRSDGRLQNLRGAYGQEQPERYQLRRRG